MAPKNAVPNQQASSELQHRCMCCDRIIENLSDETISIGLDLKLGLVSDECSLICNDCTARLISDNQARKSASVAFQRRKS